MINLVIGGEDYTKYLIQDSYSAPLSAVKDSEHCFTAADGSQHEPILGYEQILDFTLSRLTDEVIRGLYKKLVMPNLQVSFNLPIKRTVPCACQNAGSLNLRSAGENLWQVQVSLKCLELLKDSDGL